MTTFGTVRLPARGTCSPSTTCLASSTPPGSRASPSRDSATQDWYKHIGRGENIRTATDLPIPLTRTMSHWFGKLPADLDVPSALRWAQVRGMGGDDRLARTILDGRIGIDFDRDDFWIAVIRWLIAHPELAPRLQGAIIDYLYDQKFVPSVPNPLSRRAGQARQPIAVRRNRTSA